MSRINDYFQELASPEFELTDEELATMDDLEEPWDPETPAHVHHHFDKNHKQEVFDKDSLPYYFIA